MPVQVDVPKGVKPVGKAARRAFTYTPLRPRRKQTATAPTPKTETAPAPKIEEVTSSVFATPEKKSRKKKQSVATAA